MNAELKMMKELKDKALSSEILCKRNEKIAKANLAVAMSALMVALAEKGVNFTPDAKLAIAEWSVNARAFMDSCDKLLEQQIIL